MLTLAGINHGMRFVSKTTNVALLKFCIPPRLPGICDFRLLPDAGAAGSVNLCIQPNVFSFRKHADKLAVLKAAIQANIETIKSKTENPASVVALTDIQPILEDLAEIINGFNTLIDANNAIVAAGPTKRTECTDAVFSLLSFMLKDVIATYRKSDGDMQAELDALDAEIKAHNATLDEIKTQLKTLRGKTVETDTAKDSINLMLRDSGMRGFSLEPKAGVDNVYEVRRPDGTIADNLSEGEKNFIAFLYFYHLVHGSDSADGETREKIVVIDDPVSSMDSGSLFIVSTLVRQMIEICRNNADKPELLHLLGCSFAY